MNRGGECLGIVRLSEPEYGGQLLSDKITLEVEVTFGISPVWKNIKEMRIKLGSKK